MFGTHGETHGKNVHASAHDLAQVILDVMDGRQLAHMAFDWDSAILGTSRILCKAFGPGYYFMHSYGGQGCNIPEMYPFVVQAMEDAAVRQMGLLRESGRYGEGPQAMLIVTHRPLAATFVQEWTKRVYGEQPAITRLHMGEAYAHLPESHSWVKLPEGSLEWHASRPMDPGERR
ncbi:hypothetical protein AUJ68_02660 [Candidatus Woesearchaeota archaeon CG1_02_57_44]|nr:MAG: hypothetical protein AUJ68_02660 [Candidatus Woesearchaeota archaeon CG1_02_57_44]PIN70953.1 MAG: hypothetical protein COV94_00360 [Candidatus Woesearchaeota archaeon CG11_big_fil_rev_8_21_14_0_20_57_5]